MDREIYFMVVAGKMSMDGMYTHMEEMNAMVKVVEKTVSRDKDKERNIEHQDNTEAMSDEENDVYNAGEDPSESDIETKEGEE